jgi:lactate dehydrogenase-like 2-hydroxyacid dehydrogenase
LKVAVLDDYQNVALTLADWSGVTKRAEITVHKDHVAEPDALVERLRHGAPELALMRSTARLINTSRGPIVDEQALIESLHTREIAGAAVDVFDIEPLPAQHPFRVLENVLATPHLGFVAGDLYRIFYSDAAAAIAISLEEHASRHRELGSHV